MAIKKSSSKVGKQSFGKKRKNGLHKKHRGPKDKNIKKSRGQN